MAIKFKTKPDAVQFIRKQNKLEKALFAIKET